MPSSFSSRLSRNFESYGQLCVGIDPHAALLDDWGLGDNVDGLRTFAMKVLEASVGRVGVIKPQVSFFERFGAKGFAVLEELASAAAATDSAALAASPAATFPHTSHARQSQGASPGPGTAATP